MNELEKQLMGAFKAMDEKDAKKTSKHTPGPRACCDDPTPYCQACDADLRGADLALTSELAEQLRAFVAWEMSWKKDRSKRPNIEDARALLARVDGGGQ